MGQLTIYGENLGHISWAVFSTCLKNAVGVQSRRTLTLLHCYFAVPSNRTSLDVRWESQRTVRVTCTTRGIYPEPEVRISALTDGSGLR